MTAERDAAYREAKRLAEAEYDELEPILDALKDRATQLKFLIRATAKLVNEPVADKYEFYSPPGRPR
jgi:hypothetical protein